jgi:Fic family protein
MKYNWEQKDWRKFTYNKDVIEAYITIFSEKLGIAKGGLSFLDAKQHKDTLVDILVAEAIKTSEIEGEFLSRKDVVSSIKKNIGIPINSATVRDIRAKGIAEMVSVVHKDYESLLTEEMLFDWHKLMFQKNAIVNSGCWRVHEESMQVVSGRVGKEVIHFVAPPSSDVPKEMRLFIKWFNDTAPGGKKEIKFAALRSAIAHLYFESIHPFEDGNGRVGRSIAEKALLQTVGHPLLLSLSVSIEKDKSKYYESLRIGSKSNEITEWVKYFIETILDSFDNAEKLINFTLQKTRLFDKYKDVLTKNQFLVLKKMLSKGMDGYVGGMTAKKYMKITKVSKSTATREMGKLKDLGIFKIVGEGRSTSYLVNFN